MHSELKKFRRFLWKSVPDGQMFFKKMQNFLTNGDEMSIIF